LEASDPTATFIGPLLVRMTAADLDSASGYVMAFRRRGPEAAVTLVNTGAVPMTVRIRFPAAEGSSSVERTLDAGEVWHP
jgi:hypothetical protein